jgi:hypothetical protein
MPSLCRPFPRQPATVPERVPSAFCRNGKPIHGRRTACRMISVKAPEGGPASQRPVACTRHEGFKALED